MFIFRLQTTQQDLENEDITKLAVSETTGSFESVSQTSPSLDFVIEKATSRVLTDFNIENRADTIFDETLGNSSNRMDDYDNYDYTEPTLPPSLPNLV